MIKADELKAEISLVQEYYQLLKDYLSGAEYDISEIRGCIHSLKERLSKVRLLYIAYCLERSGKEINLPIDSLLNQMDFALALIESNPQQSRAIIQMALAISPTKIEDIIAFLDFLKERLI